MDSLPTIENGKDGISIRVGDVYVDISVQFSQLMSQLEGNDGD